MKLATATIHATVAGNVACVVLMPGAQVDLDQVVGHQGGKPVTLAAALGDLAATCEPVVAPVDSKPARRAPYAAPAADDKE